MRKEQKLIASDIITELAAITRHCCNYQQITKLIMDKLAQAIDYSIGVLFYVTEGEMLVNVKHNTSREFLLDTKEAALKEVSGYVKEKYDLSKIKSFIHEDPSALSDDLIPGDAVASVISAPLIIRDRFQGLLMVTQVKPESFSKDDQDLLNVFTNHAAIVIDNVILYSNAEQRMLELSVLHEVGKTLSSILNLDELLDLIAVKSTELVRAERVSLMFLDEKKQTFSIKSAVGIANEIVENTEQPVTDGIAGMVARKAKILSISDIEEEASLQKVKSGAIYSSNSFVCLPIIIREKVVGVLNVSEKTAGTNFDEEDVELLDTFLNQAATAIENAILYRNMEQLAVTDGLTMVYNHRYFQERLEKEVRRAERHNLSLTLMMLDVDFFKRYNDTYGHPKGDIVLKEVTRILRENIRDIDIIARYGGEEFVVILPETDHRDASHIAERMRKSVEDFNFPGKTEGENVKLSISIGVTTYPSSKAKNRADIIDQADKALYQAKESGRNQVCAVEIK